MQKRGRVAILKAEEKAPLKPDVTIKISDRDLVGLAIGKVGLESALGAGCSPGSASELVFDLTSLLFAVATTEALCCQGVSALLFRSSPRAAVCLRTLPSSHFRYSQSTKHTAPYSPRRPRPRLPRAPRPLSRARKTRSSRFRRRERFA